MHRSASAPAQQGAWLTQPRSCSSTHDSSRGPGGSRVQTSPDSPRLRRAALPPDYDSRARLLLVRMVLAGAAFLAVAAWVAWRVAGVLGPRPLLMLWAAAEAGFALWFRRRYVALNAQPPRHAPDPAAHDPLRAFERLLEACEFCAARTDPARYLSAWFCGADPRVIRRGNVAELIAYGFWYRSRAEMEAAGLTPLLERCVSRLEGVFGRRLPPGYRPGLQAMTHLWHPLRVHFRPLAFYAAIELIALFGKALLLSMGCRLHVDGRSGLLVATAGLGRRGAAGVSKAKQHGRGGRVTQTSMAMEVEAVGRGGAAGGVRTEDGRSGRGNSCGGGGTRLHPAGGGRLGGDRGLGSLFGRTGGLDRISSLGNLCSLGSLGSFGGFGSFGSFGSLFSRTDSGLSAGWVNTLCRARSISSGGSSSTSGMAALRCGDGDGGGADSLTSAGGAGAGGGSARMRSARLGGGGGMAAGAGRVAPRGQAAAPPRAVRAHTCGGPRPPATPYSSLDSREWEEEEDEGNGQAEAGEEEEEAELMGARREGSAFRAATPRAERVPAPAAGAGTGAEAEPPVPVLFLHGVGVGLISYINFIRCLLAARLPLIAPEFKHVSLRLMTGEVPTADDIAAAAVGLLDELGLEQATAVCHSYGTFVASRLVATHGSRLHGLALLDPVCLGMFLPRLVGNFVYLRAPRLPRRLGGLLLWAKDLIVLFLARDLNCAAAMCRRFYWSELIMWPQDMPPRTLVSLGGQDALLHAEEVLDFIRLHAGKVLHHPHHHHSQMLIDHAWQEQIVADIARLARREGGGAAAASKRD